MTFNYAIYFEGSTGDKIVWEGTSPVEFAEECDKLYKNNKKFHYYVIKDEAGNVRCARRSVGMYESDDDWVADIAHSHVCGSCKNKG